MLFFKEKSLFEIVLRGLVVCGYVTYNSSSSSKKVVTTVTEFLSLELCRCSSDLFLSSRPRTDCVCVVCVFFPFIVDIKFVGRTSWGHTGGRSHRVSHPPSFCGACLYFSREKDSAIPFPRRLSSRILCTNDLVVLHPLGIFILFFSFLVRKIPFAGIELTSQRVRELRGTSELPGRPA